jgi:hypothetical protein
MVALFGTLGFECGCLLFPVDVELYDPSSNLNHSIWVIMDRLTKVAHFILVITTYSGPQLVELYMSRIVCLHGVPKKIVSNRGTQLTSKFSERLHETWDTQLRFSFAYHSQTDGQTERVNQILEDMVRACALQYGRNWDKSLSYTEFSYNNSYQESFKMAPFEMRMVIGDELRCFGVKLENGRCLDPPFCRKPRNKFVWLGRTCELCNLDRRATLRFIQQFKILERRGEVAYQLELPPQLSDVHDVFHVSQLRKCLCVPKEQFPMEDLDAKEDLSYQEYPLKILETSERITQNMKIKMCKV